MAQEFSYNIAYTAAANKGAAPEERLSRSELWQGIKRGGRHPGDFGTFVLSCKVVSGDKNRFVREMMIGEGAVHTKDGTKMLQDVVIQEPIYVAATTQDTGAVSTLVVAGDAQAEPGQEDDNPVLTLFYELKMGDHAPAPDSPEAEAIRTNYSALARNMVTDCITHIRKWKLEGKLAQWAEDNKKDI
ncbi:hypothetical protein B0T14DRAFT_568962 [Immersiella caudata]|uniref:DUF1857-domain-containing protein n=1 Tax=Immersiella caudata TaxID=314043 RepID=A0AA39WL86_9PEZI|nr:hypothetical protein B0T14DRAFT_568962 [Immersiella caudata]